MTKGWRLCVERYIESTVRGDRVSPLQTSIPGRLFYCDWFPNTNLSSVICHLLYRDSGWSFVIRDSGWVNPKFSQQSRNRFHWQTDNIGERAINSLDYGSWFDLCSISSRFLERINARQITVNQIGIQSAKSYFGFDDCGEGPSFREIANGDAGEDFVGPAGKLRQHPTSFIEIGRFAKQRCLERYESVSAQNDRIGLGASHGESLPTSIEQSQFARC